MATIETLIHEVLTLIVGWRQRVPTVGEADRLTPLFARLQSPPDPATAFEFEDAIWEVWTRGRDQAATAAMDRAIAHIASKRYAEAETALGEIIAAAPEWAEAWNKRATLFFLMGRDTESLRDILRTLMMEPRHFGAISGFAQIALRAGDVHSAVIALKTALEINPYLAAAQVALHRLEGHCAAPLH